VCYYIKVTKFVKLEKYYILEDFRELYYIKVTKFVKLSKIGPFEDFLCFTT